MSTSICGSIMVVGWFGLHPRLTFTRFPWRKELHFHLSAVVMMSESSGGKKEWSCLCCVNLTKKCFRTFSACTTFFLGCFQRGFFFTSVHENIFPHSGMKRVITSSSISLFATFYESITQTYESSTSCVVSLCNREGHSKPLTLPKFRQEALHAAFCIKYLHSSLLAASFNGLKRKYQHIKQAVWKRENL